MHLSSYFDELGELLDSVLQIGICLLCVHIQDLISRDIACFVHLDVSAFLDSLDDLIEV